MKLELLKSLSLKLLTVVFKNHSNLCNFLKRTGGDFTSIFKRTRAILKHFSYKYEQKFKFWKGIEAF